METTKYQSLVPCNVNFEEHEYVHYELERTPLCNIAVELCLKCGHENHIYIRTEKDVTKYFDRHKDDHEIRYKMTGKYLGASIRQDDFSSKYLNKF